MKQFLDYPDILGQPKFLVASDVALVFPIIEEALINVSHPIIHKQAKREIEIHAHSQTLVMATERVIGCFRDQARLQSHDAFVKNILQTHSLSGQSA